MPDRSKKKKSEMKTIVYAGYGGPEVKRNLPAGKF